MCIKVPAEATDERSADSLRREHEILRGLDFPGVIKPLALEERDGLPALVLEDAGEQDLAQLLARGPVDTETFLALAPQMARAVGQVHQHNVLHRNLAPESFVFSTKRKTLTLVDFAAATTGPGQIPTRPIGSLLYTAPEQTGRLRRKPDQRADLYSLGAIFYEMLTGRPPFPLTDSMELVHAHLAVNPVAPSIMNPAIPQPLSDLALRLLAKAPEERYQSAEAVLADLEEARLRWRAGGKIEPFELARDELARELPLPTRLYARDAEIATMARALERVLHGGRELLVLTGRGGVGKSALFAQFAVAAERRGRVVSGKCDLLARNLPYAPLLEIFGQLVADLLAAPEPERAELRRRIEEATAPNTRVLTDFVPRLVELVGEAPPVPTLGSQETQNRLHMVLQAFLRVVAAERPLVCFVDDLQWADAATLKLLPVLVDDPGLRALLVVIAYRDHEVADGHPMRATLETVGKAGVPVSTLTLAPLDVAQTTALLSDALRAGAETVAPLAEAVQRKTAGNPLFVRRFLRYLHRVGLLMFDRRAGSWRWELRKIAEAPLTDNVVDLLVTAIGRLPRPTQQALAIAACIGARFELEQVAAVAEAPVDATARALSSAVDEDLIVPVWSQSAAPSSYRFAHDRIQQAVYSTLAEAERRRLHLRIGRRLLAAAPRGGTHIFEIADQLDRAADVLHDPVERLELIELNLRAGVAAKARSAHGSALVYLGVGLRLLPATAADVQHALWFQLHREAAECAGLNGEHARADALIAAALPHAASVQERAELYEIQIFGQTLRGAFAEALRTLTEALRSFGVGLPDGELGAAAAAEVAEARRLLSSRAADQLLEAPLVDGDELSFVRILGSALAAASYADPVLLTWLSARLVSYSLRHGPAPQACFGLSMFAMALLSLRDYLTARDAAQLAIRLAERLGNPVAQTRATFMYAGLVSFWVAPIRDSIPLLKRAKGELLALGDHHFAPWNSMDLVNLLHAHGCPLDTVLAEIDYGLDVSRRFAHGPVASFLTLYEHGLRELIGNAPALAPTGLAAAGPFNTCLYQIVRLQTSYLLGDLESARSLVAAAAENIPFIGGMFFALVDYAEYAALTLVELAAHATGDERAALLERIAQHRRDLELWAERCPQNVRHKCALVDAEVARLQERPVQAARLYQEAIEGAAREEFTQDLALAEERCGRAYLRLGLKREAELHLAEAIRCYVRWGATAKVRALAREFPRIGLEAARSSRGAAPQTADLDVLGLLRAAETLACEVELPRLLEKLMRICLETAGAERGLLILEEAGVPFVRSTATATTVAIEHTPLTAAPRLARAIVEHVRSTGETVVLDDARLSAFAAQVEAVDASDRSVLAVPLRRANRAAGVLVLENHLVADAFSPERVRALDLLSGHISVAIENSLLFEEQRRAEGASQFLGNASAALAESLDYDGILARVAHLALPAFADFCAVDLADQERIRRVAVAHVDATIEAAAANDDPPDWSAQVLRTKQPVLIAATNGLALGTRSALVVPLTARGCTFGALSLCSRQPGRYSERDLALAEELGRRAGTAIDNARLYAEAQAAVRVRDEFLSVASHELRTPLTSLKLVMQAVLQRVVPMTSENLAHTFGIATRQIARLTRLLDELLNVSRIRAGRLALELEDVDLGQVVREATDRLDEDLRQSGCPLSLQVSSVVGHWDKSALDQVVTNILSNAAKFGAGKPIEVTLRALDGKAQLVVTDRGIGIAAERLPHIFERYERAVSARQYGGLGLGLYIARAIVEALGGSIQASSAGPDTGATFTVELPLSRGGGL